MSSMQQSSKAQDRTLGDWFHSIQQGSIKLPRFQRFEAWDRGRIASFLNTIINNLPVGVTLALEVAGTEKFESRYIASSTPNPNNTVTQHLLDGQQRLTAFWRAMHNNYEGETFYVYLPQFNLATKAEGGEPEIRCISRYVNKFKLRMPLWADDPAKCFERGMVPVSLLRPGDIAKEIDSWLAEATKPHKPLWTDPDVGNRFEKFSEMKDRLKAEITTLRERVTHFNLPYLSLPADTSKDVALQVFINMNTNSKALSMYDIIVAEVENIAGKSLHDLVAGLNETSPHAARYGDVSDLVLTTSALLQEELPNTRGMIDMDKQTLLDNWPKVERGLSRMASFLEGQRIFDETRLPTNAVLAVIAAAYAHIPDHGDFLAKAEKLLRRYLWSAFFTDRYENSAATRASADFKALKKLLLAPGFAEAEIATVPVLDVNEFPLADVDSLLKARWPKAVGIKARAIVAVTTYLGAFDFADHQSATFESVQKREYHHVFPDALLAEAEIYSFLALNCALVTGKTNRMIGRKDPLEYLSERVEWADEGVVTERLKSHLISFDLLSKAHYDGLTDAALKEKLTMDFNAYLLDRAQLVAAAMLQLTQGNIPSLNGMWTVHLSNSIPKNSEIKA